MTRVYVQPEDQDLWAPAYTHPRAPWYTYGRCLKSAGYTRTRTCTPAREHAHRRARSRSKMTLGLTPAPACGEIRSGHAHTRHPSKHLSTGQVTSWECTHLQGAPTAGWGREGEGRDSPVWEVSHGAPAIRSHSGASSRVVSFSTRTGMGPILLPAMVRR